MLKRKISIKVSGSGTRNQVADALESLATHVRVHWAGTLEGSVLIAEIEPEELV